MEKKRLINRVVTVACVSIMVLFMVSIAIRVFTRQVLVLGMGMENQLISCIFFDNASLASAKKISESQYGETDNHDIKWDRKYPFKHSQKIEIADGKADKNTFLGNYKAKIESLKERIVRYTQGNLVGYSYFTECSNYYENIMQWNYAAYSEYNGLFQLSDGFWTSLKPEIDMTEHISALVELKGNCDRIGAEFLYVQAPYKISKYEDESISGYLDFSNQNADNLLYGIRGKDILTLDLRDSIIEEGLSHHDLFYITDHHWKPTTGLWAAGCIGQLLIEEFGLGINVENLHMDKYRIVEYPEWFLGSYGKKATLGKASPENFQMLYPRYDTNLHLCIPSIALDRTGDFSITYNMEAVEEKDLYNKSPYAAYNFGDRAIIHLDNKLIDKGDNILFIHDSFADSVLPFLATTMNHIDSIDLRYFNGSLINYLEKTKPDIVIVMYNAGEVSHDIDWMTHTDLFDFR